MSDLDLAAIDARASAAQSRDFQSIDTRLRTTRGSVFALGVMSDAADTIEQLSSDVPAMSKRIKELEAGLRALHQPVEIEPSSTICGECSFRLPNGSYFGKVEEWPCATLSLIPAMDGGDAR